MYKKRWLDLGRGLPSRKGQVTLFIILGIIILLAVVLVLVFRSEIATFKPEEVAVTEKGKVENFVNSCLREVGNQALLQAGLQGGYIDVPEEINLNGNAHLRTSPVTVIPYWLQGEDLRVRPLAQIKEDIDQYVEEHVRDCLLNTQAFSEVYQLAEKSEIASNTQITPQGVRFTVVWEIDVETKVGDVVAQLREFVVDTPVKLQKMHTLAQRIVERELRENKLGDLTQDLLALEHENVPFTGFAVSCERKSWPITKAKETFQDMLRVNIGALQIKGAAFREFSQDEAYYQNHYIWDIGDDLDVEDITPTFRYQTNYPFIFTAQPQTGGYLKSNSLETDAMFSAFCLQNWKFVYDIHYPIMLDIQDDTTGYRFKVAFTAHVQKNLPDRNLNQEQTVSADFSLPTFSDEEYCADRRVPMTVKTYELVDNKELGVYTREPLPNVNVSFSCLRYSCDIGRTEYNFANQGNVAAYTTNFPYCVGGVVRAKMGSYKETVERIVTEDNGEVSLELRPTYTFPINNIRVIKHLVDEEGNIGQGQPWLSNEVGLVELKYATPNETIHEQKTIIRQIADERFAVGGIDFLAKADFPYTLKMQYIQDTTLIGGYQGNWTVSWTDLQQANELIFHVATTQGGDQAAANLMATLTNVSKRLPAPELR